MTYSNESTVSLTKIALIKIARAISKEYFNLVVAKNLVDYWMAMVGATDNRLNDYDALLRFIRLAVAVSNGTLIFENGKFLQPAPSSLSTNDVWTFTNP